MSFYTIMHELKLFFCRVEQLTIKYVCLHSTIGIYTHLHKPLLENIEVLLLILCIRKCVNKIKKFNIANVK